MSFTAFITAFGEMCQAITALCNLTLKFSPYLMEWADKKDTDEIQTLLNRHDADSQQRALLLSERIKSRRAAQP